MNDERYEAQVVAAYLEEELDRLDWERGEVPRSNYRPDETELFADRRDEADWERSAREYEEFMQWR